MGRQSADFDNLRKHDLILIDCLHKTLFFIEYNRFGDIKRLNFAISENAEATSLERGREAFAHFFEGWAKQGIQRFLRRKALEAGLKAHVVEDTDCMMQISIKKAEIKII